MKLPDTIKIGLRTYTLEVKDVVTNSDDVLWGLCDRASGKIEITQHHDLPVMQDTLVHEVLHAVYDDRGLEKGDEEERIVKALATGLVQVLVDNPKLRKWVCQ